MWWVVYNVFVSNSPGGGRFYQELVVKLDDIWPSYHKYKKGDVFLTHSIEALLNMYSTAVWKVKTKQALKADFKDDTWPNPFHAITQEKIHTCGKTKLANTWANKANKNHCVENKSYWLPNICTAFSLEQNISTATEKKQLLNLKATAVRCGVKQNTKEAIKLSWAIDTILMWLTAVWHVCYHEL